MTKKNTNIGEAAFEEMIAVDERPYQPPVKQPSSEPEQRSLFSKTKRPYFNPEKLHPNLRKKYEEDMQFVKAKFLFHECPAGQMECHMGPYDEVQTHIFQDGQVYNVRKYVADYINENCKQVKYSETPVEINPGIKKYVPLIEGGVQRANMIIMSFL